MQKATEGNYLDDLVKYEADNYYSRKMLSVKLGSNLQLGTVVGLLTDSGELVQLKPGATDGSEKAIGVLARDVREADTRSWIIARHAQVASHALIWPDTITDEQKLSAISDLEAQGIILK